MLGGQAGDSEAQRGDMFPRMRVPVLRESLANPKSPGSWNSVAELALRGLRIAALRSARPSRPRKKTQGDRATTQG